MRGSATLSTARTRWRSVVVLLVAAAVGCGAEQGSTEPDPATATVEVEVFLANPDLGDPCGEVFPVVREVDADDPITGALEALLAGPTAAEQAQGYGGWFSQDTVGMLLDVEVVDDTVHVVFGDLRKVIPNASSSCGSAGLLAQLDATLLAFDQIGSTRYSLADQTTFYEWLQLGDPDTPAPDGATEPDGPAAGGLTVEDLEHAIATEFGASLAPRDVTVACGHHGTIGRGDVTVCSVTVGPTGASEPDWGRFVAAVLDDDGRVAWSIVYWNLEGQPARMDPDGDGIPRHSLYAAEDVASVVHEVTSQQP